MPLKKTHRYIDFENINDSRRFWETLKPFLSDKGSQCSQIKLVDQENVISDDKNLSKEFSNFFDKAVKNSGIKTPQVCSINEDSYLIDIAFNKYADHPIILKIKKFFNETAEFYFRN